MCPTPRYHNIFIEHGHPKPWYHDTSILTEHGCPKPWNHDILTEHGHPTPWYHNMFTCTLFPVITGTNPFLFHQGTCTIGNCPNYEKNKATGSNNFQIRIKKFSYITLIQCIVSQISHYKNPSSNLYLPDQSAEIHFIEKTASILVTVFVFWIRSGYAPHTSYYGWLTHTMWCNVTARS